MFKECLIDIDFNLLVLNITSVLELSLLPDPASLSAGCERRLSAGLPSLLFLGCCFSRDGHSFGAWCYPALWQGQPQRESSRSSWLQAPSQVPSPDPSLSGGALGGSSEELGQSVLGRSHGNAQHGPWGRAKPSSSGSPGAPPAQERLCLRGWWQHTPALVPSPSSFFPHVAHSDAWDVS